MQTIEPILQATNLLSWFYVPAQYGPDLLQKNTTLPPRRAEEIKMALTSDLKDFIASGFASIPEVERVYTLRHSPEEVVYVRVVAGRSTRAIRDRIYAKEKEIIDVFNVFDFDFGIVASPEAVDPALKLVYKKA